MKSEFHQDEYDDGPVEEPIDLRELLFYGAGRYRYSILLTVALGLFLGVAYALSLPNTYTSIGKVHLRLGAREQRTPENLIDGEFAKSSTGMADELALLDNPEVHERVVKRVGADRILAPYDPAAHDVPGTRPTTRWLHQVQSWWFTRSSPVGKPGFDPTDPEVIRLASYATQENCTIEDGRGSNIIYIAYSAFSPDLAQQVAQNFLEVAQEWHRESYAPGARREFLQEELAKGTDNAQQAINIFAEHRGDCGFYDIEVQKQLLVKAEHDLEAEIDANKTRISEIGKQLTTLTDQLENEPSFVESLEEPPTIENPTFRGQLEQLRKFEDELDELRKTFSEDSEAFKRQKDLLELRIREVKTELDQTDPQIPVGEPRVVLFPNTLMETLRTAEAELARERDGLLAAVEEKTETKNRIRERLNAALDCEPTHRLLQMDIDTSSSRLEELQKQLHKEEIIDTIDSEAEMNSLRVIQKATFPEKKDGPRRAKFVLMGLFGGLAFGLCLAVLRQMLDSRLRYPENVERTLGIRLLAVVPEQGKWRRLGGTVTKHMHRKLGGG